MLLEILLFSTVFSIDARSLVFRVDERPVCLTKECQEYVRLMLTNMNTSADPCVDFYEYACGNWPRSHPLPAGENSWQMRMDFERETKRKVEEMLKLQSQHDDNPVKIMKQWYKACMDIESIDKRGMKPLVSILNEIGGWPITMERNKWNENGQKWQNIDDYYAHLRGSNLLHDVRVAVYGRNSKELTAVLDVPDMPPYSWTLDQFFDSNELKVDGKKDMRMVERYWNFTLRIVTRIAEAGEFNVTKDQLEEDVEDMLYFEWKLSKITSLVDDYVNTTVGDFQTWYNNLMPRSENSMVNWASKIIRIFKEAGIDVHDDTILKVTSPGYFGKLISLLDETSTRTIVNYLHWSFVSSTIAGTTNEMRELYEEMDESEAKVPSRSDLCLKQAKMEDVVAYEYVKRYFAKDAIIEASNVVNDMAKEMEVDIKGSNWMNGEIKQVTLNRIKQMKKNIGYPDWYNNATVVDNYFGELTLGSTYFENALKLQRHYKLEELRRLKYEDETEPWIVDPLTLNAFYLAESNTITVPLANLQSPFFSKNQPNTINYALTGYLLAHELHHLFDEQRRLYNEHGEKINWPETMTEQYYKSAQCFIEQYNNYTLDGTPSGPTIENYGTQTFDENMPDTMGLRTAFKAYKQREIMNGEPELGLIALELFSNDQIFFLSFANLWCDNRDYNSSVTEAKLDVHSVARLRSIGALANNQDFANAFSCPLGSPMNPEKKCNIWKV